MVEERFSKIGGDVTIADVDRSITMHSVTTQLVDV